jgi:hypothetical protein
MVDEQNRVMTYHVMSGSTYASAMLESMFHSMLSVATSPKNWSMVDCQVSRIGELFSSINRDG